MKTFYSLIKIVSNELSGDSMTIGILVSSPEGLFFKVSKAKKAMAKSMLSIDGTLIDFIEREMVGKVNEQNSRLSQSKSGLFEASTFINQEYFSYLSKYSNGLLKFTSPILIADKIDQSSFLKLYGLFVDSHIEPASKKDISVKSFEKMFYSRVSSNLIEKVKDKVHTNELIGSDIVPTLSHPFEIDCVGLNGVLIGAKAIAFTQSKETLSKSLNTYISVIAHLSATYQKAMEKNNFYLIADEPQRNSPVYQLWSELYRNESLVKLVSSNDSGEIAEKIDSSGASRFIS
jgi:hypothetical protein